jgi:hypothetical protein
MAAMPQLLLPVLVALPAASAAVFDVTDRAAKARVLGSHVYDPRGTRPPSRTDPFQWSLDVRLSPYLGKGP